MYACMYVRLYVYIYVTMYVCMYGCVSMCVCVCVCVYIYIYVRMYKGKAVPLQAQRVQEVKVPGFRDRMVVGCQPYAPAVFTPRKCSWYSFLSEAESTSGP